MNAFRRIFRPRVLHEPPFFALRPTWQAIADFDTAEGRKWTKRKELGDQLREAARELYPIMWGRTGEEHAAGMELLYCIADRLGLNYEGLREACRFDELDKGRPPECAPPRPPCMTLW